MKYFLLILFLLFSCAESHVDVSHDFEDVKHCFPDEYQKCLDNNELFIVPQDEIRCQPKMVGCFYPNGVIYASEHSDVLTLVIHEYTHAFIFCKVGLETYYSYEHGDYFQQEFKKCKQKILGK